MHDNSARTLPTMDGIGAADAGLWNSAVQKCEVDPHVEGDSLECIAFQMECHPAVFPTLSSRGLRSDA